MEKVRFEDVATRVNTREDRMNTSLLYYVGGEHIDSNELLVQGRGLIKGSTIGPMFYCGFKKGDVLLVSRNPHLKKASMVGFDGICSEKTFVLGTKDSAVLLQEYLAVIVQSDAFWKYCEEHKSGGVNYFLNWSTLAKYEFKLPSIKEQKEIADKVWAAYRLKESYKELLAATDEMVKSQFIEMFGNNKWKVTNLDKLCHEWIKGQAFKKDSMSNDGCNKCIHYGELFTKYGPIINEVYSSTDSTIVKASKRGDILFPASDVTPDGLARCSAIMEDNVLLGGDIIALRPNSNISPQYLSWAINMQKEQLLQRITGSVVRHISAKGLKTVEVVMPPMTQQKQFVAIAEQSDKSKFVGFKSQFIEIFKGDNQVPLGDICNIEKGATITRNDVLPGEVPVVAGGQEPSCYHNVANREAGAITVSASGAYAGYINFWNCPIFASDCNTIISKDDEKTDQTFVYFGLRAMQKQIYGLQKGGAQPHVYGKDLQKFMFPYPSYAKQIEFSKMAKQADKSKYNEYKS